MKNNLIMRRRGLVYKTAAIAAAILCPVKFLNR